VGGKCVDLNGQASPTFLVAGTQYGAIS
jgi:hypothetical protein